MPAAQKAMVVLLEAEELCLIHKDWPKDMRLAVCLMPTGDCQLVMYHKQESGLISDRLMSHLGMTRDEIAVHPPLSGFPTHRLKYSDERALEALLTESEELVEDASDYSVNFAFAEEEGLDPVVFLGLDVPGLIAASNGVESAPTLAKVAATPVLNEDGDLLFSSRRAKAVSNNSDQPRKLRLDLAWEAARLDRKAPIAQTADTAEADGDRAEEREAAKNSLLSTMQIAAKKMNPSEFSLRIPPTGGVEITAGRGTGSEIVVRDQNAVLLRDDRALLAIELGEAQSNPARIRVLPHAVPLSVQSYLSKRQGDVALSFEAGYAYVTLEDAPSVDQQTATKTEKEVAKVTRSTAADLRRRKRWAGLRLLALTTVTTIAIFLVLSSQMGNEPVSENNGAVIDWDQFRLSMRE